MPWELTPTSFYFEIKLAKQVLGPVGPGELAPSFLQLFQPMLAWLPHFSHLLMGFLVLFTGVFFLFFLNESWFIICVNFCYTAKRPNHTYIVPFLYNLPSWSIPRDWIAFPVLYSRTSLFIDSECNSLHLLTSNSGSIRIPLPTSMYCSYYHRLFALFMGLCQSRHWFHNGPPGVFKLDTSLTCHCFVSCLLGSVWGTIWQWLMMWATDVLPSSVPPKMAL